MISIEQYPSLEALQLGRFRAIAKYTSELSKTARQWLLCQMFGKSFQIYVSNQVKDFDATFADDINMKFDMLTHTIRIRAEISVWRQWYKTQNVAINVNRCGKKD